MFCRLLAGTLTDVRMTELWLSLLDYLLLVSPLSLPVNFLSVCLSVCLSVYSMYTGKFKSPGLWLFQPADVTSVAQTESILSDTSALTVSNLLKNIIFLCHTSLSSSHRKMTSMFVVLPAQLWSARLYFLLEKQSSANWIADESLLLQPRLELCNKWCKMVVRTSNTLS